MLYLRNCYPIYMYLPTVTIIQADALTGNISSHYVQTEDKDISLTQTII